MRNIDKNRPSWEDTFIDLASVWAKRSTCSSRISVGAVLVNKFNQVIASGYNGSPRGMHHCNEFGCVLDSDGHCVNAIHAEENAILQCARTGTSSDGCVLYVTHIPCGRCAKRILQAGIVTVIYNYGYRDQEETLEFFKQFGINCYQHLNGG